MLFCLTSAFGQHHEERILRFHSGILIDTSGRIEVAERIKVYAGGNEIKRGIARELPLHRRDVNNKRVRVNYNILAVQCDGVDSKFSVEHEGEKMVIYIGDKDVFLFPGEYEYTIMYESYGHIGFFDGYDELYWNVTGNGWVFPIEKASALITLPNNSAAGNTAGYTGAKGESGSDCTIEDLGNVQMFTTTRRLEAGEGLTVAVAFPRDMITRPPPPTKGEMFWMANQFIICSFFGLIIWVCYFLLTLRKVRKKPPREVVIPTFKPPRGLSPASVCYLYHREYNRKMFTATLVEMAVKGAVSIICETKGKRVKNYSLVSKEKTDRLRSEEQQMHTTLFTHAKKMEVSSKNYKKFNKADGDLKKSIEKQWNLRDFFRNHWVCAALGGLLVNMIFVLYLILTDAQDSTLGALCAATPFISLEIIYLMTCASNAKNGCAPVFVAVFFGLIAWIIIFAMRDVVEVHWLSFAFFTGISCWYLLYCNLLKHTTSEGAKLAAELEGFKMYMKTAEEHRLNLLTPPEKTPELFEKLLPYAIALDVSNRWCKKFDSVLKQFDYRPEWYDGNEEFAVVGFATTFAALGSSLNSSISGAQTNPSGSSSWSSGSSGGGFSGGGGGGGGGHGW